MKLGWLFVWWYMVGLVNAHRLQGSFQVSPTDKDKRVYYITKFACSIGECKYNVRAGLKHVDYALQRSSARAGKPALTYHDIARIQEQNKNNKTVSEGRLVVRVVLDDEWDMSHDLSPCKRAELGRGRTTLSIPLDGSMSAWSSNSFRQSHRPHFWYFFGEDCRNSIGQQLSRMIGVDEITEPYDIAYEIEILQTDGGYISYELRGMLYYNILHIVVYTLLLTWMYMKQSRVMKRVHVMVQILNGSCLLHLIASFLSTIYLYQINHTGNTYHLLDGLCDSLFTVSHIAITSCLILIALGITLNAPQNTISLTLIKVLAGVIFLTHLCVVLVDKYVSDPRYKYYGIEGSVGYALIVFRIILYGCFILCFKNTTQDPRTPATTQRFLKKIFVPSSIYFISLPLLVVMTKLFKAYLRHAFLFHTLTITHIIATVWLAQLFLSKGEYFKVSQMSQSFLPGGVWRTVASHHVD